MVIASPNSLKISTMSFLEVSFCLGLVLSSPRPSSLYSPRFNPSFLSSQSNFRPTVSQISAPEYDPTLTSKLSCPNFVRDCPLNRAGALLIASLYLFHLLLVLLTLWPILTFPLTFSWLLMGKILQYQIV